MLLASSAFIFVPLLAATMIFGGALFAYASHCFVNVVEQTASGNDEVLWPNDPIYDWLWEAAYMCWLTAIWLGPIVLILRATEHGKDSSALAMIGAASVIWLVFPITLLSSMSGATRWALVSPRMLARLFGQRFGSLLAFYIWSAPDLAVAAICAQQVFFKPGSILMLGLGAIGLGIAFMIYARQLGRLAHLVEHTRDPIARPSRPRAHRVSPRPARVAPSASRQRQPRDLPPVDAPAEEARVGYDVRFDDGPTPPPAPPARQTRPPDLDDVPYDLEGPAHAAPPRPPLPKNLLEPSEYEMSLAIGGQAPPPPQSPWTTGVFSFPFYQKTLPPTAALSAGFGFLGLLIRALIILKP